MFIIVCMSFFRVFFTEKMLRRAVETFLVVPCVIGLNQRELFISSKLYVVLQNDMSSLTITKPLTNGLLAETKNKPRLVGNEKYFQLWKSNMFWKLIIKTVSN